MITWIVAQLGRLAIAAGGKAKDGWRWATATPAHLLAALLVISVGLNLYQWHLLDGRKATISAVKTGRKAATAAQIEVNHAPAAKSKIIAEKSNDDAKDYYAEGRRAGLAYAAAHRVPRAAPCPQRDPDLPRTDHAAAIDDGSGVTPGMVAVSQADFDLLTGNSTRLAKVHQDAEALIANGIVIPSVEDRESP